MTDRAIVSFFKREAPSINITEELLTNPSNKIDELIQAYYFLCELILDDMSVDPADEKYPEHMARPHFIVKTREAMNLIFNNIYNGSDEFCYTDLLEPDPRRTRNLLNQMIRFYNFKCEIAKDFTKIDNDIEDQCRSVSFEKQLEKKANEQLDRIKEELHEFEAASKTLEQKELGLRQKLNEEKGKKDMERKNCEGIQERLQEMEERIEVTKRKIFELEEAGRRLEMNIVNSPDRIIGELENLKLERVNMLQKMNSTLQEGRRLDREMAICTTVAQCFASLAEDIKRMETAQDQMLGFRAIEDKRKQELNELEKQRKTLMQELKELEGKYENKMRDLQNEVQISRKEIEAIRQQRNQLENDEKEMAKRLTNVKETIRQHQQKIKRIDRQFLIASDNYDNSVQKMLKDGEKMKTMIDEQQKMLDKILEKATSILD